MQRPRQGSRHAHGGKSKIGSTRWMGGQDMVGWFYGGRVGVRAARACRWQVRQMGWMVLSWLLLQGLLMVARMDQVQAMYNAGAPAASLHSNAHNALRVPAAARRRAGRCRGSARTCRRPAGRPGGRGGQPTAVSCSGGSRGIRHQAIVSKQLVNTSRQEHPRPLTVPRHTGQGAQPPSLQ